MGLFPLHPDFGEWSDETLEALQTVTELDLAKVVRIIKNSASERPPDRRLLANIFGTLLAEYDSTQLASMRGALKETEWVPVGITGVVIPTEATLPTPERVSVLGRSNHSYVDLDAMDKEVKSRVEKLGDEGGKRALASWA